MGWLSKAFKSITGGDILGFAGGILGANSKNKANSAATQQSIAFEREKAQNAHQWEVEDLRKAGLNPILSAGGSGASTGSPTIIPAGENPFSEGLNSASATRIAREQIDTLEKQRRGIKLDNDVKYANAHTALLLNGLLSDSDSNGYKVSSDNPMLEKFMTDLDTSAKTNELLQKQIDAMDYDNARKKKIAELFDSEYGYAVAALQEILPSVLPAFGGIGYAVGSALKKPPVITHSTTHNEHGTYRVANIHNGGKK